MGKKITTPVAASLLKARKKIGTHGLFTTPPTPRYFSPHHTNTFEHEFGIFLRKTPITHIVDTFESQLTELYYLRNAHIPETSTEGPIGARAFIQAYLGNLPGLEYSGVWVYYPWTHTLVHCLPPDEHQEVRTARNKYLVTDEEQKKFQSCTVGIAGLSIGNSVALSLAYSGGCNRMKLADPDTFALTNLNRVRVGIQYLGAKKAYVAAQQIYEVNPYAELTLFPDGITQQNIESFLTHAPALDLIVDEMDNIQLKIFLRLAARAARIPVVMATDNGDNAIIDVDRFDLAPDTSAFKTLPPIDLATVAGGISYGEPLHLTSKEKVRLATKLVGAGNAVPRMQESLMHVGRDLVSWPQLGIAAFTGGAALAYAIKKFAVGNPPAAGKTHISLDALFGNDYKNTKEHIVLTKKLTAYINDHRLISYENMAIWDIQPSQFPRRGSTTEQLLFILHYAVMAPSAHNTQPWRFSVKDHAIRLFGDPKRIPHVSDPTKREYYISLGACLANIHIALTYFGFEYKTTYFPSRSPDHIADITITKSSRSNTHDTKLFAAIKTRFTDRGFYKTRRLPPSLLTSIQQVSHDPNLGIHIITDQPTKNRVADWIADSTRQIMKKKEFRQELSHWLRHNYTRSFDGMPAHTAGIDDIQSILGPFLMKTVNLASGNSERKKVASSPALVILTLKKESAENWVRLGEVYEIIHLTAAAKNVHNATLTALVESPVASRLARYLLKLPGKPQAFFRLGYSDTPTLRSPRILPAQLAD